MNVTKNHADCGDNGCNRTRRIPEDAHNFLAGKTCRSTEPTKNTHYQEIEPIAHGRWQEGCLAVRS
jgi:hypothetical protein